MAESVFGKPVDNGVKENASAIAEINNKIGTVPSGQTVEGQITALNSEFGWEYLGEKTGTSAQSISKTFNEVMVVAIWGSNALVSVSCVYPYDTLDIKRRFIGGTYTSASDFHGVQIDIQRTSVALVQWISNGGDQTSTSKIRVYIR